MNNTVGPLGSVPRAVVASFVPWILAVLASAVALAGSSAAADSLSDLGPLAVGYLGFVVLPCAVVLVAARSSRGRLLVLAIMSVVSVVAAVPVVTSADAQAGLSILLVLFVAVPLTGVLLLGRIIGSIRNRNEPSAATHDLEEA